MSKKQKFIDYVESELFSKKNLDEIDEDVKIYWEATKAEKEDEKPLFTENGRMMLKFLQEHQDVPMWKAKAIGDELLVSSRVVAGAMRKLKDDGYIEKVGENPVLYMLTDSGKNVKFED